MFPMVLGDRSTFDNYWILCYVVSEKKKKLT